MMTWRSIFTNRMNDVVKSLQAQININRLIDYFFIFNKISGYFINTMRFMGIINT